jgi:hypothetical protein
MDDERVDRWLRALPREMASPGFTTRVLARLDRLDEAGAGARSGRAARIFGLPRLTLPAAVLAATLAVAASLSLQGGGMLPAPVVPPPAAPQAVRPSAPAPLPTLGPRRMIGTSLASSSTMPNARRTPNGLSARQARALLEEIQSEHHQVHDEMRQREAQSSTVYLGGDEDMDLVVHLDRVRELPDRQADPPPYQYD